MDDNKFKKILHKVYNNDYTRKLVQEIPITKELNDELEKVCEEADELEKVLTALKGSFGSENIRIIDSETDLDQLQAELELRDHLDSGGQLN